MKAGYLALPILAQSDDAATLLSVKFQASLETGVDHLLNAVGTRNVTQMSALLQNLVEENIDAPYDLDGDVKAALEIIKQELLGDIRGALNEAHCQDQVELHNQILCFEGCEKGKKKGADSCPEYCDGSAHKECRDGLLVNYKHHITQCRALDDFMKDFETQCPKAEKKCCLLSHTTWNCGGLCAGAIHNMEVDPYFGTWLMEQVTKFQSAYEQWIKLHKMCTEAYHSYVEMDAKCDCLQAECETNNCEYETCHFLNCEDNYNRCWARCEAEYERTNEAKECLEKDRKIDWSATEKIECYVDVLLAQPSKEELLAKCGTEDCINKFREEQYKHCNTICPEVDFDASTTYTEHDRREGDQDVTGEGVSEVRTMHRAADGSDADVRCTAHLDLDFQVPPCCNPCVPRPEPPCTGKPQENTANWVTLYAKGAYGLTASSHEDFNDAFLKGYEAAGVSVVRRMCNDCRDDMKEVYFRRKTNIDSWDAYNGLLVTWRGDVGFHVDFDIYSTLDDALNDENAFTFCNGNDPGIGFPRDCGPRGYIPHQWTSLSRGGRQNVEYAVYSSPRNTPGGTMSTTSYMFLHYGQYGHFDQDAIPDFSADTCHSGEHTQIYAYNLCDCLDCAPMPDVPPPACTPAKQCCASTGGQYDYRQHDIKVECSARPALMAEMDLVGNGCCRFDGWSATNKGYTGVAECLATCAADPNCMAADVARPRGEDYHCYHFHGDGNNFRLECGTQSSTEQCYRKILPLAAVDEE